MRNRDDRLLAAGDQMVWHRPPRQELEVPLQFEVTHDDGDRPIVNKFSCLLVMPAGGFPEYALLRLLEQHCPVDSLRPVYRLGCGNTRLLI